MLDEIKDTYSKAQFQDPLPVFKSLHKIAEAKGEFRQLLLLLHGSGPSLNTPVTEGPLRGFPRTAALHNAVKRPQLSGSHGPYHRLSGRGGRKITSRWHPTAPCCRM